MTDAAGSLGLGQLARAHEMADMRRVIAARYDEAFSNVDAVKPRASGELSANACHLYVVRIDPVISAVNRTELIGVLADADIGTSVHYRPLHMHSFYGKTYGYEPEDYPVAAEQFDRIVSLPIFPGMTTNEVDTVVRHVSNAVAP